VFYLLNSPMVHYNIRATASPVDACFRRPSPSPASDRHPSLGLHRQRCWIRQRRVRRPNARDRGSANISINWNANRTPTMLGFILAPRPRGSCDGLSCFIHRTNTAARPASSAEATVCTFRIFPPMKSLYECGARAGQKTQRTR
jgi:hypothetical protein